MEITSLLENFTVLDTAAVGYLVLTWVIIGYFIENPPKSRPSTASLMSHYRIEWMKHHVTRQPRIFDAAILATLRDGTTFLASACLIAIGGGLAAIANADRLSGVAAEISLEAPVIVWDVKILLVIFFVSLAFMKFVWSNRLFGYCGVMMAAIPNDHSHPHVTPRVQKAAELNISAAKAFNRGLRSVYFALGALGWLLGPEALLITATMTVITLARREFFSGSRSALLQSDGDLK